jgi:hypothetical protein
MKTYNGHRSWNAWNVSLWIGNDEQLYRLALDCKKRTSTTRAAAKRFIAAIGGDRPETTPDGATYNLLSVKLAIEGLE